MPYIRIRMISDSRNPSAGPYGPYAYLAWRDKIGLKERYLGKCVSIEDMKKIRLQFGQKLFEQVESAVIKKGSPA